MPIPASASSQIATDIVSGGALEHPWFYIVFLSLTVIGAAIGGFLSSYFKRRGETLATKADFSELKRQLGENTQLAEEIKNNVQARYGEQASLRTALRERTESLVMATFDLEDWLTQLEKRALSGEKSAITGSPMAKIAAYRDIYFHEIGQEFTALGLAYHAYVGWILEYQRLLLEGPVQSAAAAAHFSTFQDVYGPFLESLTPFRARVIEIARSRGGL